MTANGDWISVTKSPWGISRIRTHQEDKALVVRPHGAGGPRPGDWGEMEADGVFPMGGGPEFAFTATYVDARARTRVQTNAGHGVIALAAYHEVAGGQGARDFFTREFYVPATPERTVGGSNTAGTADELPPELLHGANNPRDLIGTWAIVDQKHMHVSMLECARADDGLAVLARGRDGAEWGVTRARLYADAADPEGTPSFLADFELPDRRVCLQGRPYLGVLVVGVYAAYTDGSGRSAYWARDCFARQGL